MDAFDKYAVECAKRASMHHNTETRLRTANKGENFNSRKLRYIQELCQQAARLRQYTPDHVANVVSIGGVKAYATLISQS